MQDVVKVGIVGCGRAGRKYAAAGLLAHPQAEIVGLTSRTEASARQLRQDLSLTAEVFPDYPTMLESDGLTAVALCTPPPCHFEQAKLALAAGKHVIIEKPATTSIQEAEELIALASQHGRQVLVAQNMRFAPSITTARNWLAYGMIGDVHAVSGIFEHGGPGKDWFFDPAQAGVGGSFSDLGVHLIDTVRFLLGPSVWQLTSADLNHDPRGIDTVGEVSYQTPPGVTIALSTSWLARTMIGRISIQGNRGNIQVVFRPIPNQQLLHTPEGASNEAMQNITSFTSQAFANPYYYFIETILGRISGDPMGISLANNLPTIQAVMAAYRR